MQALSITNDWGDYQEKEVSAKQDPNNPAETLLFLRLTSYKGSIHEESHSKVVSCMKTVVGVFLTKQTTRAPSQDDSLCCLARITLEKMTLAAATSY